MSAELDHAHFDQLLAELKQTKKKYVDGTYDWYCKRVATPRRLFRGVGFLIILASVSIPYLLREKETHDVLASVAGFTVALLAALNGFFNWQAMWQKYVTVQLFLEHAMATWDVAIAAARRQPDFATQSAAAVKATNELLDKTRAATQAEAIKWFSDQKAPTTKNPSGKK